ncbi:host attachment protein [Bradyrhizobium erythrophlei]|uniref:baeRF12 domain-containing protein n=1 Tax=Bradyrhizobium erythrophlei TaxID=1437360 RepID=UPI0035E4AA3E
MTRIPHDALVIVGDGRKALFLRNEGDEAYPNLKAQAVFEDQNPPTREQGSDRPGRVRQVLGPRSAVEGTDWHDLGEHRFIKRVAEAAEKIVRRGGVKALVIVAPIRTLAELRLAVHPDVKRHIVAEVAKELTRHPVGEIEKHLLGHTTCAARLT